MNNGLKFQIALITNVPVLIASLVNSWFYILLAITIGATAYFMQKIKAYEKPSARYYLIGFTALVIPIIIFVNPYYILVSELIIYLILMTAKKMLPKKLEFKKIEESKNFTIIQIEKSIAHPFSTGFYSVKGKAGRSKTITWTQTLFGKPELKEFN